MCTRLLITLLSFSLFTSFQWKEISSRDLPPISYKRYPLYRLMIPAGWREISPSKTESIADTKEPLATFEKDGIKLVIHNFPSMHIAPIAQVARWKGQYPDDPSLQSVSWSGFQGLQYEGQKNEEAMMGWALSLDPLHHQALEKPGSTEEEVFYHHMQADVTLKATGPHDALLKLKQEICTMAHSFELIQEIPCDD